MARVRYSFTVPDTDKKTLQEIEKLKRENKLTRLINEFFELYFASEELRNVIRDIDCRDERKRLNKLNDILRSNKIYDRLGLKRKTEDEDIYTQSIYDNPTGQQPVNGNIEGMLKDMLSQALKDMNVGTQKGMNSSHTNSAGLSVQDTTVEDNLGATGEDAGDTFEDFFGDFIL